MTNLEEFKTFCEKEDISKYITIEEKEMFSPASEYFYTKILESKDTPISDKLDNDPFLERVYACLIAWRLNRGQSWLVSFEDFKTQLNQQRKNLIKLDKIKYLEKLDVKTHKDIFEDIFKDWNFVKVRKGEKNAGSKFVSISKTLHFLLPDLIIPMDNAYTSKIIVFSGDYKNQCKSFLKIQEFGKNILITKPKEINRIFNYKKDTKPKLIDNLIINLNSYGNETKWKMK